METGSRRRRERAAWTLLLSPRGRHVQHDDETIHAAAEWLPGGIHAGRSMEKAVTAPTLAIAERFRSIKPSATVEMSERVRGARAAGREIIGMASGDPKPPPRP